MNTYKYMTVQEAINFFRRGVVEGYEEAIRVLRASDIDVNTPLEDGRTLILMAVSKANIEAICALKKAGVNLNSKCDGSTGLHLAVCEGNAQVIRVLKGADANALNKHGITPLWQAIAARPPNIEVIAALLEVGADVSIKMGSCTLLSMVMIFVNDPTKKNNVQTNLAIVNLLKTHEKTFKKQSQDKTSRLTIKENIAISPLTEVELLKKIISCQEKKEKAEQCVHHITDKQALDFFTLGNVEGYAYAIDALKATGADLNMPTMDGRTLISIAAYDENVEAIRALKSAGVNIDSSVCDSGITAVNIGVLRGNASVIRALKGAELNKPNLKGIPLLFEAIHVGNAEVVAALLEIGADITIKYNDFTPLDAARELIQNRREEASPKIVQLLEAQADKLKRLEEKRKREQDKQEKTEQQAEIRHREEVRRLFSASLQIKLNFLAVKNQEIKVLADKRKVCRLDIFVQISAIVDILENTLEGSPNNKRLSLLTNNSSNLEKACDLNDKIKAQGKEVLEVLKDFEQLIKGLKGELPESEYTILAKKYEWFSKAQEALMDEPSDAKNELLNITSSCLQKEWVLVEGEYQTLLDLVGQLSGLNNHLSTHMEDIKSYRKENVAGPKKDKFNKKTLTPEDLDKVKVTVAEIRKKIETQQKADTVASQEAQERARQLVKKSTASRSVPRSIAETLSIIPSREPGRSESEELTADSSPNTGVPRRERRMQASIAYAEEQRKEERKIQKDIRCLYAQETADNIANGLFPRPLPRDEEVKERVEHSDLLIEELGILQSVVDLLESDTEWTPEMRYALWGSFARVNEVIGQECRDASIIKIAKRLRNVIFKHYETIQAKMSSDIQCLGIVKAWVRFYEKPKVGMFVTEKGVLTEVNSPLLSSFYEDTSALKREMVIIDFVKYRACLTDMQQYFESRNKEDDNVIAYAANLLFLGVTGAKFKALRVMSKDKPEAVLVMKEFELLNIYASQIIAEGAGARHPRKAPVLYLHSLVARQEINTAYEYEDNDMQAILVSRLRHLREANPSEDTDLYRTRVLAAVDNIGFRQLATRLEEDKKLNGDMGVRSVLIPCNLGNAHWVGIYLQFNTSGQVVQALYMDSLRQNTIIPLTLQKQLQMVYPTAAFERRASMMQEDSTSCGAYAIENLLLCAQNLPVNTSDARAVRQLHLQALEKYRPDFYPAFYERQRTNTPTIASLEKQLGYVDKLKKVVFSKQELHRILCIKSCLSRLSKKSEIALLKAFGDQSAADFNHAVHLTMIRSVLEESLRTPDLFEVVHLKALSELLLLLCGIQNWLPGTVLPQSLDFKVGYEEILAVANIACTPEQVVSTQQSVMQQIEWDRQFALQLPVEFSSKVGVLKNKGIVSYA